MSNTKLKIIVDFGAVNNKRHLDIAIAALVNVNYGNSAIRKAILLILRSWAKQCNKGISEEWIESCKGLIAGDWTWNKKENNGRKHDVLRS